MRTLKIGRLATAAEVGIDTVRFYERAGLLKNPQRTAAGYRLYDGSDVARVRFIRRVRNLIRCPLIPAFRPSCAASASGIERICERARNRGRRRVLVTPAPDHVEAVRARVIHPEIDR
jgi:hypothetical protein